MDFVVMDVFKSKLTVTFFFIDKLSKPPVERSSSFTLSRENKLSGFCQDEGGAVAFWCGVGEGIWSFNHFSNSSHPILILVTSFFSQFQKYMTLLIPKPFEDTVV